MQKNELVVLVLLALSSICLSQGVNHCKARMCGKCRLKDGTKYCSDCDRSFKLNPFQHSGTEGTVTYSGTLGECSTVGYPEESKKCRSAYPADSPLSSGCGSCEWGFVMSEGTLVNGKTDYTCTEPAVKIEKCLHYFRHWSTKAVGCNTCEENYSPALPDYTTCVLIPEAQRIPNCKFTIQNSQSMKYSCGHCKEGYLSYTPNNPDGLCVATTFKGCNQENEAKTQCVDCASSYGWWAVDVSNEKGQICEHFGSIIGIARILALSLGLIVST